jgi:hypothetical protein
MAHFLELSAPRSLAAIQLDIVRTKHRLGQLRAEEYKLLIRFPCKGCGAEAGQVCVKVSGVKTAAHVQRHNAARQG